MVAVTSATSANEVWAKEPKYSFKDLLSTIAGDSQGTRSVNTPMRGRPAGPSQVSS